jgi:three-Cys-motif partner protein
MDRESLAPYTNREQAAVKHALLKCYLERLIMITAQRTFDRIAYIDAFAGPWKSTRDDLSDTSPGLAISTMESCRVQLARQFRRSVQFRALFVEKDPASFERLKDFTDKRSTDQIKIETINEDFAQSTNTVARWIRDDEMTFVLIDPTGWKDVIAPKVLAPLLCKARVEMLINVMWNFINLAMAHESQQENLNEIVGKRFEELPLESIEKGENFMRAYLGRLKTFADDKDAETRLRAALFPVEFPQQNRVFYYLAYVTHHAKGMITFLQESERAAKSQKEIKFVVRQQKREDKSGISDLFGDAIDPENVRDRGREWVARTKWLTLLPHINSELVVNAKVIADVAEECGCLISPLQEALRELIREGIVTNLDAKKPRPKNVVDYDKSETLKRIK